MRRKRRPWRGSSLAADSCTSASPSRTQLARGRPHARCSPPLLEATRSAWICPVRRSSASSPFRRRARYGAISRRCTSISGCPSNQMHPPTWRASPRCMSICPGRPRPRSPVSCRWRALLRQRTWSDPETLLASLRRYGTKGGAGARYVEGILGRLVEAADDCAALPSPADPNFLCGLEFASLAAERAHFARHFLELEAVEHRVRLSPGELLVVDNLRTAHGRAGTRTPEELHQLCVGYRGLDTDRQRTLSRRVLAAFERARR